MIITVLKYQVLQWFVISIKSRQLSQPASVHQDMQAVSAPKENPEEKHVLKKCCTTNTFHGTKDNTIRKTMNIDDSIQKVIQKDLTLLGRNLRTAKLTKLISYYVLYKEAQSDV